MDKSWREKLLALLVDLYGEEYAARVIKHLDYVLAYTEYGAPGHMDFILIKALYKVLEDES